MVIKKTDRDIPEDYDSLHVYVAGIYNWDTLPSSLYVRMVCKDEKGNVVKEVMSTKVNTADATLPFAFYAMITKLLRFVGRIPQPKEKKLHLWVSDLETYLSLTRQVPKIFSVYTERRRVFMKEARHTGLDVVAHLGPPALSVEYREFLETQRHESRTLVPSLEMRGEVTTKFFEDEKTKRDNLWITRT